MELNLATNDELIEELTSRSTFLGVVVAYEKNFRNQEEIKFEDFKIVARGIPPETAAILFHYISEDIKESVEEGDIIFHEDSEDEN